MSLASAAASPRPDPLSGTPLLEVQGLTVRFESPDGPFDVVRDVSFAVRPGRTFCLVGESGCGKSMTARALLRLVPEPGRLAGGRILFQGGDLAALPEKSMERVRGRDIGMIFQEPMTSLNPVIRVGEQVAEPLVRHLKLSRKAALAEAAALFRQVGIPAPEMRLRDYPHQLSGGMRQRVMIAIALACRPAVLIADEPTTALDVSVQAQIFQLLKDTQRRLDTSILFITHDMGSIAAMADHVIVMYAGTCVESGSAEAILLDPRHPYTRGLIACIPRLDRSGGRRETPLPEIPGMVPSIAALGPGCPFASRCALAEALCRSQRPPFLSGGGRGAACWKIARPAQGRDEAPAETGARRSHERATA